MNNEINNPEVKNIGMANTQQDNSEAYLNALRQLENEKKAAKKAKRKKRRKRILIAFLVIIVGVVVLFVSLPSLLANDSVSNIKEYIEKPENRTQSLQSIVDEYVKYDLHSEEKEIKNLYKLAKIALDKEDLGTAGYLFKFCVEYSADYKDKIIGDTSYESVDEMFVACAKSATEAGNYYIAVQLYSACEDSKSVAKEETEAKYNLALEYIQSEKYADAREMLSQIGDYKYSKALIIWTKVKDAKAFNDSTKARGELKSRLKDPSSYEEISVVCWATAIVDDGEDGQPFIRMRNFASIEYSATNSFGGRIQDSYYWDEDGEEIPGSGYTTDELKAIIDMNTKEIIEKAKTFK